VPATRRDMRVALECQWRMERDERNREEIAAEQCVSEPGAGARCVPAGGGSGGKGARADVAIGGLGVVVFCVIFTVAAAYSGLKVGQVMESAIPISILAIGLARL